MKLFNIFKKESSNQVKSSIQKMDNNQLSKIIGGGGPDIPNETNTTVVKSKSNVRNN